MKRLLSYAGVGVLVPVVLFLFYLLIFTNFLATEYSFKCSGTLALEGITRPTNVFIKLTEYSSWSSLSTDSDGSIYLEISNEWTEYYEYVEKVGDQFQIYDSYPQKVPKGNFSELSKTLAIDLEPPFGFFDGICIAN